jgi:tetratricopeptide (TPR) repeat protein
MEDSMRKALKFLAAALVALPMSAAPALSAGDGGAPANTVKCKKGLVWNQAKNKCVPQTSLDDTESIYQAGRDLAYAGRYDEAITLLSRAAHSGDARILNFLGYSHRKQGRVVVGLGYYQEAVKADPSYTLVREYLGEAHLQMGDLASARQQLGEIERLCGGRTCHEYEELAVQIAAFKKTGG